MITRDRLHGLTMVATTEPHGRPLSKCGFAQRYRFGVVVVFHNSAYQETGLYTLLVYWPSRPNHAKYLENEHPTP